MQKLKVTFLMKPPQIKLDSGGNSIPEGYNAFTFFLYIQVKHENYRQFMRSKVEALLKLLMNYKPHKIGTIFLLKTLSGSLQLNGETE